MKKILVVIVVSFCLLVSSALASPPKGALMDEYFSKRFVTVTYSTANYHIDFKEVQAVLIDAHGHISHELAPISQGTWGSTGCWIIFKNGRYLLTDTPAAVQEWQNYKDFLRTHPEFLSIP